MAEVRLDLDLPAELVLHPSLEELGLLQDLEGDNIVGGFLPRKVHSPKLSPSQRLADLKIIQTPLLSSCRSGRHRARVVCILRRVGGGRGRRTVC